MPGISVSRHLVGFSRKKGGISWLNVSSGDVIYRKGTRDGFYVIDKSTNGGSTWTLDLVKLESDEDEIIILIDAGVDGYRHLVRDGAYVIDVELDETGFDGDEGVNWENIVIIDTP